MFALLPGFATLAKEHVVVNQQFDEYTEALVDEKYEQAFELFSREFREVTPFESFVNQQKELHRRYGKLQSVNRKSTAVSIKESQDDWTALVTSELHFERGVTKIKFGFHYKNGKWVIFGYKENPN